MVPPQPYAPTQIGTPPTVPGPMYPPYGPYPGQAAGAGPRRPLLLWGSILRIVGAIIGGIDLIYLGSWVAGAATGFLNPLGAFQTLGTIIEIAGVSVIFTGLGWSMQTWARGL